MSDLQTKESKFSISVTQTYNPIKCLSFIASGFTGQGLLIDTSVVDWLIIYCLEDVEKRVGIIRRKRLIPTKKHLIEIKEDGNLKTKTIIVNLYDQSLEKLVRDLLEEYLNHLSLKYEELSSRDILSEMPAINIHWNDRTVRKNK